MSAASVTAIYQRGGGPSTRLGGSARYVPRCSSPMSFLARVPYSLALLATTAGLFLIFNLAGASAAAVVGGPTLASGGRIGAAAADSDFALNFTQVPAPSSTKQIASTQIAIIDLCPNIGIHGPCRGSKWC